MAIEEIPKAYRYQCDACGATHKQENANGHYTNSTPPRWSTINIKSNCLKDFSRLFCDECSETLVHLIREWKGRK